jgi:hypothetical protein
MKKVTFLMALAVAAGMASCTAQSPKADLKTDIDSLSYAIGMARTEGLDQYLAQQGIDSTQMSEFLKGFNEGAAKIDKKDVAYMAGLQVGQMVSKQWVEGFNQQIFGNDSTQSISRENLLAGFVAGVIGKEFWYRGNYVVIGQYALMLFLFYKLYGGFKVGYLRVFDVLFSQILSVLCVNLITYLQLALIGHWKFGTHAAPILEMTVFNLLFVCIWVVFMRWIYAKIYPPRRMLLIYGEYSPVDIIQGR